MGRLAETPAKSLGTPGRKRLEIARALATEPKVLLLDEAMAGLTQREVQLAIDLVRDIHRSGITLVIVEHIMEVIMSLATSVLVFHQGREIARGARARSRATRPSSRPISANELRRRPRPTRRSNSRAGFPDDRALLKIEHLEVRYGDLIGVSDVSLEVPEGSVVALLGSNGGGKTTVLNAIAGLIPVHSGANRISRSADRRPQRVFDRARRARTVAGRLAAVRAAKRREQLEARRDTAARQEARLRCSNGSTISFRSLPSGATSAPAPCPAANARCWRSAAR